MQIEKHLTKKLLQELVLDYLEHRYFVVSEVFKGDQGIYFSNLFLRSNLIFNTRNPGDLHISLISLKYNLFSIENHLA